MEATGELQNPKDVLSKLELQRYKKAANSFDKPVVIISEEEVRRKRRKSQRESTWHFVAKMLGILLSPLHENLFGI